MGNFLVGNALYWLERFGVDGLRVDAVASMLYRDYSRKALASGSPTCMAGARTSRPSPFLKRMNEVIGSERPGMTLAEEVDRLPAVAPDLRSGGLGFHQVEHGLDARHAAATWRDPIHRRTTMAR